MAPPRNPRYDTLDAWRGLACVLVVLFHATYQLNHELPTPSPDAPVEVAIGQLLRPFAHAWVGVPLFFVISGYCIAASADSARRRPHPAGQFFLRRFRRIYPPLWIFLAGTVLLHLLLTRLGAGSGLPLALSPVDPADVSPWSWAGSVTLTEEWRWHFVGPGKTYFQWALWTLCYEEQFYLLLGLVVLVAPRRLFAVAGVVSVAVFLIVAGVIPLPFSADGFFFGGPWLAFAAGIAVYYRRNYATPVIRRVIDVCLLAATVWAARSVPDWNTFDQGVPAQLTAAFAGAFVIGLLEPLDAFTAKWKPLVPLRWCGVRCYSLYLVHGPVVFLLSRLMVHFGCVSPTATLLITMPMCVAGSLATGWAFHRWVEAKFLNPPVRTGADGLHRSPPTTSENHFPECKPSAVVQSSHTGQALTATPPPPESRKLSEPTADSPGSVGV